MSVAADNLVRLSELSQGRTAGCLSVPDPATSRLGGSQRPLVP